MSEVKMPVFDFAGQTFVVTGGSGVLGATIVQSLLKSGARVAVLERDGARAREQLAHLETVPDRLLILQADVLDKSGLEKAAGQILRRFRQVDGLLNFAGGNHHAATTSPEMPFFDIPADAFRSVLDLNLIGTLLPCQVFGKHLADRGSGMILNISSMNAFRPLTRIPAYSAAKAAVSNFTQWLAVHLAQEYSPNLRVNAVAPGFFHSPQNRYLLYDNAGELTPRGKQIIAHTPIARFGNPQDLTGTVLWLLSPAAAFVTGIVVPVDGGFSAFSGV